MPDTHRIIERDGYAEMARLCQEAAIILGQLYEIECHIDSTGGPMSEIEYGMWSLLKTKLDRVKQGIAKTRETLNA